MADLESLLEYNEIVRKMFACEEEGFEFYNKYGYEKGFSVRRSYCEWDSGHNELTLRKFVCSCEGFREAKHLERPSRKRKPRDLTRFGCRAKFVIARDQNTEQWYVKDFIDEHNHAMSPPDLTCFLRSHRRISDEQKADIVEMQSAGIRKHKIRDIMKRQYGGYDMVGFTSRDLYNFCHRYKAGNFAAGDAQAVISHLTDCQNRDPDFFFKYKTDGKGHLEVLLWCDSQCLVDYAAFGDVVVFDSTYKTNRYNLPLVPFVGVNQHYSTVLFACGVTSHEDAESYMWMLRAFSEAMNQKFPISVITDGDRAMHKAIRLVWPNTSHRLCIWHLERNIVTNIHDDKVKAKIRCLLYDVCSIEENDRKWQEFLVENEVTDTESWLYQMYEMREVWCAAYYSTKCFLGLRANQRSESLNATLQVHLDRKMTLVDVVTHIDQCLERLCEKEASQDSQAVSSKRLLPADASILEEQAADLFTPTVFATVRYSIRAANKCNLIEILDGDNTSEYIVGRKDKEDVMLYVKCELSDEGNLEGISCSCLKLQTRGLPCSHIFFVLGLRDEDKLPACCVSKRWTMGAKSAFPATRKSTMYDYSDSLQRYRKLRNSSHAAAFAASRSQESYERLDRILNEEAAMDLLGGGDNMGNIYGPALPQALEIDSTEFSDVLDPMRVASKGAPKKKLKSISDKKRSKVKCTLCKGEGHNRRTCSMRKEESKLPEDMLDI